MFTFKLEMQDVKVRKCKISRRRELQIKEQRRRIILISSINKAISLFVIVKLSQDMQIKLFLHRDKRLF